MEALKWISALSLLGAVAALVYWTFRSTEVAYRRGHELLRRLEMNPQFEVARAPLLAQAGRAGIVFVPLIGRLLAANRFGLRTLLDGWQAQLLRAGLGNRLTPVQLLSAALACALATVAGMSLLLTLWGAGPFAALLFGLAAGAPVGFILPALVIRHLAATRVAQIEKRLPFAIEFMLLAMEASSSFPAAMNVYCVRMNDDPLADELQTALREIEDGLGVQRGLTRLSERLASDPVSAFVLALTTGIETGQPVKTILKTQADLARQRRFKTAEEVAKKAGTQALFPLLLVMVSVFLLMLGPMALKMLRGNLF
jgi:tight adherence protein C